MKLKLWRDKLVKPIFKNKGVVSLDLSESQNRLTVGVEEENFKENVESELSNYDIPREAAEIEVVGSLRPASEFNSLKNHTVMLHERLTDNIRPLTGGLQLRRSSGLGSCSIGFIVKWNNKDALVTNSHCTSGLGSVDSNEDYYQPHQDHSSPIGTEIFDPSPTNRYSDASVIELSNGINFAFGTIAATIERTQTWGEHASLYIQDSSNRYTIIGERTALVNLPVVKTGRRTGSTICHINDTCEDYQWVSGDIIYCQDTASPLFTQTNDSGSPVFTDYTSEVEEGEVELVGIIWGLFEDSEEGVFSPMSGVRNDLSSSQNYLQTFYSINVSITGSGLIESTGTYTWDAEVQDEKGSVSYQWSIKWEGSSSWNNLGTSSSQSVTVNNETDFDLKVVATDAQSSDNFTKQVTVNFDCSPGDPCSN